MGSDECPHDVVYAGMCGHCGTSVDSSALCRPGFLTTQELKVSSQVLGSLDRGRQRMALILDLDHTLVTTNTETGQLQHRPGLKEFLLHVQETFELYLYTQATGSYAHKVLSLKDLSQIFPTGRNVLVVDDREDVWPELEGQMLKVVPFLPFAHDLRQGLDLEGLITGVQSELTPFLKRRRLDDSKAYCPVAAHQHDQQLEFLAKILKRIHEAFKKISVDGEDCDGVSQHVLTYEQYVSLQYCSRKLFERWPDRFAQRPYKDAAKRSLARCSRLLGATLAHNLGEATHLVAAGTFQIPLKGELPCFLDLWSKAKELSCGCADEARRQLSASGIVLSVDVRYHGVDSNDARFCNIADIARLIGWGPDNYDILNALHESQHRHQIQQLWEPSSRLTKLAVLLLKRYWKAQGGHSEAHWQASQMDPVVALTCGNLAAKFWQRHGISESRMHWLSCNAFTHQDFVNAEVEVLTALECNVHLEGVLLIEWVSLLLFLCQELLADPEDMHSLMEVAAKLMDALAFQDELMAHYWPSQLAAAVLHATVLLCTKSFQDNEYKFCQRVNHLCRVEDGDVSSLSERSLSSKGFGRGGTDRSCPCRQV
ncbi:unnamed protein product [Durusdinium trenchii]|uniref:protein-serine/threonine phosphatase n=1 Tax=Durusdinium trenchii TaxID=1381693 RepID=A0ABP0KE54_9DINO